MLRKLRGHHAAERVETLKLLKRAGSVEERERIAGQIRVHERFVSEIDHTLRNWT